MLYFKQNEENRIIFSNDDDWQVGDLFDVIFEHDTFGRKHVELAVTFANDRYVEIDFVLTISEPLENINSGFVWLPTGFSIVEIEGIFHDKAFVEFEQESNFRLETEKKDFVLE